MIFRLADEKDLNEIWDIFNNAIKRMQDGGIYQWDEMYPNRNDIKNDIKKKKCML